METSWENREMPTQKKTIPAGSVREGSGRLGFVYIAVLYAHLAQSVEHAAVNRRVVGSSPTVGAIKGEYPAIGRVFPFFTASVWFMATRRRKARHTEGA